MNLYNNKHYHWQVPFCIVLIFFIIGLSFNKIDLANFIQICIFGALLWYSFETRDLKISNKASNDIELRPVINLYYYKKEHYFSLRNIGRGVAYNIKVESISIKNNIFKFYFNEANIILAPLNNERKLKIFQKGMHDVSAENFSENLVCIDMKNWSDKNFIPPFATFLISYDSLNGEHFYSIFRYYTRVQFLGKMYIIDFIESNKGSCSFIEAEKKCKKIPFEKSIFV